MHMIISLLKTVVQLTVLFFLAEVFGRAFLKHTLAGRILRCFLKDTAKGTKLIFRYSKKGIVAVVSEAKLMYESLTEAEEDEEDEEVEEEAKAVGETKVKSEKFNKTIDLIEYWKTHKRN